MPVFETAEELYTCIGGLFERMKSEGQVQRELASLKLTVRFAYTKPEASITLVAHDGESVIHCGECNEKPDVELAMTGDVAHHFWMGKLTLWAQSRNARLCPQAHSRSLWHSLL